MIKYVVGDVTKCAEPVLLHGCNAQGVMGSGVAKAIRAKWPQIYEIYKMAHDKGGLSLGEVLYVRHNKSPLVGNCITQEFYGRSGDRYVSYEAIRQCLQDVRVTCLEDGHKTVAMPMIGAGLGGGDWDVISKIIKDELTGHGIDVTVYVLNESELPDELQD